MILKKKRAQPDANDDAIVAPPAGEPVAAAGEGVADAAGLEADALLAQRCIAGEVSAWEQIYSQCHEPLLTSIRILLGRQNNDAGLADEIAARVWYAVVAKDGELLARYDAKRGARLVTFLRLLARDEMARHFRGELRRRKRELEALRERSHPRLRDLVHPVDSLAEFLGTLTPGERVFCNEYLLANASDALDQGHSTSTIWQRSHRIYRKLLRFLDA